jgi:small-conductance mechanosensitive channel
MRVHRFAGHGISIAFPQRDIHLNAARPIQVGVVAVIGGQGSRVRGQ